MIAQRDVRVWLCWGVAATVPPLILRNPFIMLEMLVVVLTVRMTCVSPDRLRGWQWFVRVAIFLIGIGVAFNVLTVHSGDRVLMTIPHSWPIVGGDLTLNALAYGVMSAFAIILLLLVGTTVSALLQWSEVLRIVPARLSPIVVAGSVTWAFLPQLGVAMREIQEANLARGRHIRGAHQLLPVLIPLLAGSLERALTTAEALEARGFGVPLPPVGGGQPEVESGASRGGIALLLGLVSMLVAAYGISVGMVTIGLWAAVSGIGLLGLGIWLQPVHAMSKARYRMPRWTWRDSTIICAALVALAGLIWRWIAVPEKLRFEVYPSIAWPAVDLAAMVATAFLIVPAVLLEWKDDRE